MRTKLVTGLRLALGRKIFLSLPECSKTCSHHILHCKSCQWLVLDDEAWDVPSEFEQHFCRQNQKQHSGRRKCAHDFETGWLSTAARNDGHRSRVGAACGSARFLLGAAVEVCLDEGLSHGPDRSQKRRTFPVNTIQPLSSWDHRPLDAKS